MNEHASSSVALTAAAQLTFRDLPSWEIIVRTTPEPEKAHGFILPIDQDPTLDPDPAPAFLRIDGR